VENLFDDKFSGHEYKEFIPNSKSGWNSKTLEVKLKNIAKVIKDIDADIINLCEVENKEVLKRLNLKLGAKKYPFIYYKNHTRAIDCGLLSRYPIKQTKAYVVDLRFRPIHKVVVDIKGYRVPFFLNHWPSKRHSNQKRLEYAKKLKELYSKEKRFILLGDFNSPYEIKKDGWGSGVNYLLDDAIDLWQDIPRKDRFSYSFFGKKSALDHIIISKTINYKDGSFRVFKPRYLMSKYKAPYRWQISKNGKGKHLGRGFSDHFPIYATFSTKPYKKTEPRIIDIKTLHKIKQNRVKFMLKDVMVVDKNRYGVYIEDKNRDKIFIYLPDSNYKVGEVYNILVKELGFYKGKRQIVLEEIL